MSTPIFRDYYEAKIHRAGRFAVGMSDADAMALCLDLNRGRGPGNGSAFFNGSEIVITNAGQMDQIVAQPGNWIVMHPDGSLDVHADADFCAKFCQAAS